MGTTHEQEHVVVLIRKAPVRMNRLEGETQKLMDKYYDMCIK